MTVVGITLRTFTGPDFPPKLALNRAYFDALETAGAVVLPIPIVSDPQRLRFHYELLDALVLPGGADVEPRRYGAVPREDCNLTVMPELDEVELTLAGWALKDDLPVLAICRGIQLLNVACGGTLWQDVNVEGATSEHHDRQPRDVPVHQVELEPDSLAAKVTGRTRIEVNSLHHQAIRELGASLKAIGRSPDGLIEAVEMPTHQFVLGIQCHPEELRKSQTWAPAIFEALVAAAADHRKAVPGGLRPTAKR